MESTKIQWADATFNPWVGCARVHTGCINCYAEELIDIRFGRAKWGQNGTRSKTSGANWKMPFKWNRNAQKEGRRWRVFCASLADIFEDWRGPIIDHKGNQLSTNGVEFRTGKPSGWSWATMEDMRRELFKIIDQTPWLDWMILTKRPENIIRMTPNSAQANAPHIVRRDNVWYGTSVSDQETANKFVPLIAGVKSLCKYTFVSAEPMVAPVELINGIANRWSVPTDYAKSVTGERVGIEWTDPGELFLPVDWVIVGGESGDEARPCEEEWIRSIVNQCASAGTACFVKQLGARSHRGEMMGHPVRIDYKDQKAGDPDEWPGDLRVREFPDSFVVGTSMIERLAT